ncbi:hypothetical protein AAZX31_11G025400 [Glycine max]
MSGRYNLFLPPPLFFFIITSNHVSTPCPSLQVMWMSFMVAQWPWLEHQALIFKYLKAGLSVPLDLLLPIYKSLQLMSSHPSMGYYGKNSWKRLPIQILPLEPMKNPSPSPLRGRLLH